MILRAIEEASRTTKNEVMGLPENLTVEHLLPQKGALTDYPYATSMPLEAGETPERSRARIIHTVGNLTLLTRSLNASVSNGPFSAKRTQIVEDSDLRLNAWLRTDQRTTWSEADISERAEKLFVLALSLWPRPPAKA